MIKSIITGFLGVLLLFGLGFYAGCNATKTEFIIVPVNTSHVNDGLYFPSANGATQRRVSF